MAMKMYQISQEIFEYICGCHVIKAIQRFVTREICRNPSSFTLGKLFFCFPFRFRQISLATHEIFLLHWFLLFSFCFNFLRNKLTQIFRSRSQYNSHTTKQQNCISKQNMSNKSQLLPFYPRVVSKRPLSAFTKFKIYTTDIAEIEILCHTLLCVYLLCLYIQKYFHRHQHFFQ